MNTLQTVAIPVGIIWAYIFVGCIVHRLSIRYGQRNNWTKDGMEVGTYITAIFWPIVIAYWSIFLPVRATFRGTDRLVGFIFSAREKISARKEKNPLPVAKVVR